MTARFTDPRPPLRLIDGGRSASCHGSLSAAAVRPRTEIGPSELAAGMAEIFAVTLLRDAPLSALGNPHQMIRPAADTEFTLHELLCELRSLPWFDRHGLLSRAETAADASSLVQQGDEDHRRSVRWNGDGQLTLRGLMAGPVACDARPNGHLSHFLTNGSAAAARQVVRDADFMRPDRGARMSDWTRWSEDALGLVLPFAGRRHHVRKAAPTTASDLARLVHEGPVLRAPVAAAMWLLEQGMPRDPGLPAAAGLNGPALLSMMAEAADAAIQAEAEAPGMIRPAPVAARLSMWLSQEDVGTGGDTALIAAALGELAHFAPRLLGWMMAANKARGAGASVAGAAGGVAVDWCPVPLPHNLMIPPVMAGDLPLDAGAARHAAAATGAALTILKAILATHAPGGRRVALIGTRAGHRGKSRPTLQGEIDALAANLMLGRLAAGRVLTTETHGELRRGETAALEVLRNRMAGLGLRARVSFDNFDGARTEIAAVPCRVGPGTTTLRINGDLQNPGSGGAGRHLRAVQ